jgi:hypothetical protein
MNLSKGGVKDRVLGKDEADPSPQSPRAGKRNPTPQRRSLPPCREVDLPTRPKNARAPQRAKSRPTDLDSQSKVGHRILYRPKPGQALRTGFCGKDPFRVAPVTRAGQGHPPVLPGVHSGLHQRMRGGIRAPVKVKACLARRMDIKKSSVNVYNPTKTLS